MCSSASRSRSSREHARRGSSLALGRLRARPSARSRRSASGAAPRTRGPRAATSRRRCRGGARAARRCRASPARCAAASASGSDAIVRMLCRRSASLMSRTRMSLAIATSILRSVAACCASLESNWSRSSLVTPSTIAATSAPNSRSMSSGVMRGVLDRVVEQGGGDGDVVEAEVGEDHRDAERVRDVGLARAADLLGVGVAGRRRRPARCRSVSALRWRSRKTVTSGATATSTWWRRHGSTERRSDGAGLGALRLGDAHRRPVSTGAARSRYLRFRPRCWRGRGAIAAAARSGPRAPRSSAIAMRRSPARRRRPRSRRRARPWAPRRRARRRRRRAAVAAAPDRALAVATVRASSVADRSRNAR